MYVLIQFLFRLTFGLAVGMAVTPPRLVTSGYYRVHSYVTLGLMTLAVLVAAAARPEAFWPAVVAAVVSYVSAVSWLYEAPRPGRIALAIVAVAALVGGWASQTMPAEPSPVSTLLQRLDPTAGGLVLGLTMAAMLLGHWYLNTPTMKISPLLRLVRLAALAILARALLAAIALGLQMAHGHLSSAEWLFLLLRWLSGLLGALALQWMTWKTLTQPVPNTQSATGILYVAVIATFLGELTAQLLSDGRAFPL